MDILPLGAMAGVVSSLQLFIRLCIDVPASVESLLVELDSMKTILSEIADSCSSLSPSSPSPLNNCAFQQTTQVCRATTGELLECMKRLEVPSLSRGNKFTTACKLRYHPENVDRLRAKLSIYSTKLRITIKNLQTHEPVAKIASPQSLYDCCNRKQAILVGLTRQQAGGTSMLVIYIQEMLQWERSDTYNPSENRHLASDFVNFPAKMTKLSFQGTGEMALKSNPLNLDTGNSIAQTYIHSHILTKLDVTYVSLNRVTGIRVFTAYLSEPLRARKFQGVLSSMSLPVTSLQKRSPYNMKSNPNLEWYRFLAATLSFSVDAYSTLRQGLAIYMCLQKLRSNGDSLVLPYLFFHFTVLTIYHVNMIYLGGLCSLIGKMICALSLFFLLCYAVARYVAGVEASHKGLILNALRKAFQDVAGKTISAKAMLPAMIYFATSANAASTHIVKLNYRSCDSNNKPFFKISLNTLESLCELWYDPRNRTRSTTPEVLLLGCFLCTTFVTVIAHMARRDTRHPHFLTASAIIAVLLGVNSATDTQDFVFRYLFPCLVNGLGISLLFHLLVKCLRNCDRRSRQDDGYPTSEMKQKLGGEECSGIETSGY